MPIYTYRCENCGVQFEKKQKFTDQQLTRCPECGKKQLRKVYTPVGIVFKGSGFYATDNRSPSGANRASHSESKSESSVESKSSSEKKSTPESKTTTETKTSSAAAKPAKTD